jgi:hypothetical protein
MRRVAMKTMAINIVYGESTTGEDGQTVWDKIEGRKSIKIEGTGICKLEAVRQLENSLDLIWAEIEHAKLNARK